MKSDGWNTEPFTLFVDEKTGRLIGRGATDDKGPVLGWINVLQAHHELGLPLPVNLKFCLEGMEESGSEGLDELIEKEAAPGGYLHGVDAVCIVRDSNLPLKIGAYIEKYYFSVGQLLVEYSYPLFDIWITWNLLL